MGKGAFVKKWKMAGVFFVKKSGKWGGGIFVKVENGFLVKKWKIGVFCKKVENGFFL